jgi:molybdopterin converting factor subunit 1
MITVTVYLFGHYKDVRPNPFTMTVSAGTTTEALANQLVAEEPKLAGLERICRVAVNEDYAENSRVLAQGDEVAFIPPMSGG